MLFPTHIIMTIPLVVLLDASAVGVVLGCGLPDMIDKQLPRFGLTDKYHSVSHSLFTLIILCLTSTIYPIIYGAAVSWAIHVFMDLIQVIINKRYNHALFVLWPIYFDPDPLQKPPVEFMLYYIGSKSSYFEVMIWIGSIAIGYVYVYV